MIRREYVLTCDRSLDGDVPCGFEFRDRTAYQNDLWQLARDAGWTRQLIGHSYRHFCPIHTGVTTRRDHSSTREREKKTVVARREQDCTRCRNLISPGDHITSGPRVAGWVHIGCYPGEEGT